jgi:hypothetical protein
LKFAFYFVCFFSRRLYEYMGIMKMKQLNENSLRFYQFFMINYENKSENEIGNYIEMPGNMGFSQLRLFSNKNKKAFIGWLTGGGIFICDLDLTIISRALKSNFKRLISETNGKIIK